MQLSRKVDTKPPVIKADSTYKENKGLKVCLDTEVPNGKYKGKTGHWIAENDPSYMKWLLQEDILIKWGCILQPKSDKPKVKYSGYIDENGQQWLGIRIIQENSKPCPLDWYKDNDQ